MASRPQSVARMGCGSSTPVVSSTATTPREQSVRSGTASVSSLDGTSPVHLVPAGALLTGSPPPLSPDRSELF